MTRGGCRCFDVPALVCRLRSWLGADEPARRIGRTVLAARSSHSRAEHAPERHCRIPNRSRSASPERFGTRAGASAEARLPLALRLSSPVTRSRPTIRAGVHCRRWCCTALSVYPCRIRGRLGSGLSSAREITRPAFQLRSGSTSVTERIVPAVARNQGRAVHCGRSRSVGACRVQPHAVRHKHRSTGKPGRPVCTSVRPRAT